MSEGRERAVAHTLEFEEEVAFEEVVGEVGVVTEARRGACR